MLLYHLQALFSADFCIKTKFFDISNIFIKLTVIIMILSIYIYIYYICFYMSHMKKYIQ